MKNGHFEVGDRIKGAPPSKRHYGITNTDMLEALVIKANANANLMTISIVEHKYNSEIGNYYSVENNSEHFELIEEKEKDFWENLEVL